MRLSDLKSRGVNPAELACMVIVDCPVFAGERKTVQMIWKPKGRDQRQREGPPRSIQQDSAHEVLLADENRADQSSGNSAHRCGDCMLRALCLEAKRERPDF